MEFLAILTIALVALVAVVLNQDYLAHADEDTGEH